MAHAPNTPFGSRYSAEEVMALLREVYAEVDPVYDARTLSRMEDCGVTTTEVDKTLEEGSVVRYEVTPSRSELRIEVAGKHGDMAKCAAVVYVSNNHRLFVCDIRDGSEGARK